MAKNSPRTIALEEHFWTDEWLAYLRSRKDYPKIVTGEDGNGRKIERFAHSPTLNSAIDSGIMTKLLDTDEGRLADMDRNGIDMQVLCLASGLEPFDAGEAAAVSRLINDGLGRIVRRHPDRFAGFAAIAPQDPKSAAAELERSVKELNLKGAKITSHVNGEYLDDPKFWPIFETAEALGVPIYLHPRTPSPDMIKPYSVYPALTGSILGYGADMALSAMRLICSGVLDRYPGLKLILGHLGEALPYWLWRIDNRWYRENVAANPKMTKLKKRPGDYIKENFWVTTSGMFSEPAFLCAHLALGADRILFAVDYPYESNEEAGRFLRSLPISETDREKISHRNAEALLSL